MKNWVTLAAVGDHLLHDTILQDAWNGTHYNFMKMYEGVKSYLQQADLAFINQEGPVAGEALGISGYPLFNAPLEVFTNLRQAGFNMVSLANNHCLDRGKSGVHYTLRHLLSQSFVANSGIYEEKKYFEDIPCFQKNGITFSFLAYTYGTNDIALSHPYEVRILSEKQVIRDMEKARSCSDAIIVSVHWGEEFSFSVSKEQQYYASLFAKEGVLLVLGTHPHVIQKIERIGRTLIAYSLGNFLGGMLEAETVISGMLMLDFVRLDKRVCIHNVRWLPLVIHFEKRDEDLLHSRYRYQVYQLSQYTDYLLKRHALQGYRGQYFKWDDLYKKEEEIITKSYIIEK